MRLTQITPEHFRGFGKGQKINVDAPLVLVYGPNGYGKTSFTEAIEWLLFGSTTRRERGDSISKREYAKSIRNVHAPLSAVTQVEVRASHMDQHHVLVRRLETPDDSASASYLDDVPVASFASNPVRAARASAPVVAQHALQDFVHLKPKERRDALGAVLGLDDLLRFRNALVLARNALEKSLPQSVADAQATLGRAAKVVDLNSELASVAQRWRSAQPNYAKDKEVITGAAETLLGKSLGEDSLTGTPLEDLVSLREKCANAVFDMSQLQSNSIPDSLESSLKQTHGRLMEACLSFVATQALGYSDALLRFWRQGLAIPPNGDLCPFCEAHTLTPERREKVQSSVTSAATHLAQSEALDLALRHWAQCLEELRRVCDEALPSLLDENARATLERLLEVDGPQSVKEFVHQHDASKTRGDQLVTCVKDAASRLTGLGDRLRSPTTAASGVDEVRALLRQAVAVLDDARQVRSHYLAALEVIRPTLLKRVSQSVDVQRHEAVIRSIGVLPAAHEVGRFQEYRDQVNQAIQFTENHLKQRETLLVESRGGEIKDWYDLMNPGANVTYKALRPEASTLRMIGTSFAHDISAPACFSESQLNCVGLAVHFVRATTPGSPSKFIILDDPVQSMDAEHVEAFIASVLPRLLDEFELQVIILSHLRPLLDRIARVNVHRQMLRYTIDQYTKEGPTFQPFETLKEDLDRIRLYAGSNERFRRNVTELIRECCDRLIREAHWKLGTPLGHEFDSVSTGVLLKEFGKLAPVTPAQWTGLRDTVDFASPSHHSDPNWQVPSTEQILPHHNRLVTLANSLHLI